MLEVRRGCDKPLKERELGLVGFLEGTVGSTQGRGFIFGFLEILRECVERRAGRVIAEGDGVLEILNGEIVAQPRAVEGSIVEGEKIHCN